MKILVVALLLCMPAQGCDSPAPQELVFKDIQIDERFLEELTEEGLIYYFDTEGFLHVLVDEEDQP